MNYTQPFDLAVPYVFIKQSELPGHCDQIISDLALLLPKLRSDFAEFPHDICTRYDLGFSPRGTCFSSRYGHSLRLFTGPKTSFPSHYDSSPEIWYTWT